MTKEIKEVKEIKEIKENSLWTGHSLDGESIRKLKSHLEDEKGLKELSNIFKALSDPTRLRIIYVLSKSPLCVCDIASLLEMSQSAISHQLRILRDLKLVKNIRQGKLIIYSLDDEHVLRIFEQGLDHVKHK